MASPYLRVILREIQVCNAHIIEHYIELARSERQRVANRATNVITEGDQFLRVVLRDDCFQDFVADSGENAFGVVGSELLEELRQVR